MTPANAAQAENWNGPEAGHWIVHRDRHDRMLAPYADLLMTAAAIRPGENVLDVGCGCGSTTITAATLARDGRATGVDLSAPMLAAARERASSERVANVTFVEADAQTARIDPLVDVVISRFGLMFFDDPAAAFANLAAGCAPGGRLVFVSWQPLAENEWLLVPGAAIAVHLTLPDLGMDGPGMFALADPARVRDVLESAGWQNVTIAGHRPDMLLAGGGRLDDTVEFLRTGGMGRRLLQDADPAVAGRAVDAVRDALSIRLGSDGVRLGSAVWLVTARR
jgi:SAM-dependent methyltransferase